MASPELDKLVSTLRTAKISSDRSGADWAQQPKLAQQSGGLRAGLASELIDDIVQMKSNGRLLDSDKVRNLGFAIALRQCPNAVPFTWCETRAFIGSIGIAIQ